VNNKVIELKKKTIKEELKRPLSWKDTGRGVQTKDRTGQISKRNNYSAKRSKLKEIQKLVQIKTVS
jgi:hypothetical protein